MRFSVTAVALPEVLGTALPKGMSTSYLSLSRASLRVSSSVATKTGVYPASSAAVRIRSTPIPVISPVSASI